MPSFGRRRSRSAPILAAAALLVLGATPTSAGPGDGSRPQTATGQFEIHTWVEEKYRDLPNGGRMQTTATTQTFRGGLDGSGGSGSNTVVRPDGTSQFAGLVHFTGTLAGRTGSFVLDVGGGYDGTAARSHWSVVPGTATGDLVGLTGWGGHVATSDAWPFVTYTLTYRFG